ncbi:MULTISPECIES: glycosyltransferase family protein [unclassified Nostoc]|uniref:cytidylyltransferase domain-containing protein n=1 Tax=unclassified Nostoc TaxID=2593658 RepID=UPI0013D3F8E0|nr:MULTISPECIES: glycosyltransferase family protein [unclassified Nostoc]MBE8998091.1 glycosyltransferase family protein [Nostoc sp. LEGE 12447]NEU80795.1 NTP transferase domain-containing protein [Nostoc sp. UIC 10630]
MKTVAIIQARMGSTRLPGKVMKELCGKTILAHVIYRVQACLLVNEVIVATTTSLADDVIVEEAEKWGAKWFRGSEEDVLERYYLAAKQYNADVVVRVTSDCPLFDSELLSQMLEYFNNKTLEGLQIEYLSNCLNRSYPRGLDAEIFMFESLEKAFLEAQKPYQREHVTPYIYEQLERCTLHNQTNYEDISNYRWTLDTEEDWKLIEAVYTDLYQEGKIFSTNEVLSLLRAKPELVKLNAHVQQKQLQVVNRTKL